QRHDFSKRDVGVETHAALRGPAARIVMHAVAFEVRDTAIVHLHWHIDDECAAWPPQGIDPGRPFAQIGLDPRHLLEEHLPGRNVLLGLNIARKCETHGKMSFLKKRSTSAP